MTAARALLIGALFLSACSKDPAPKDAEAAKTPAIEADTADAVKAEKKSLEEAADAAAKLVEEESRQEIEALNATAAE
jgi:PBP1b-binding outer membrane lipoprotein LpoB